MQKRINKKNEIAMWVQVMQRREGKEDEAEGKEGRMEMRMKKEEGVDWSKDRRREGEPRTE